MAVAGVLSGVFFGIGSILYLGGIFIASGQFVALIGALLVVRISSQAIRDIDRVRNFEEFKTQVKEYKAKAPNK